VTTRVQLYARVSASRSASATRWASSVDCICFVHGAAPSDSGTAGGASTGASTGACLEPDGLHLLLLELVGARHGRRAVQRRQHSLTQVKLVALSVALHAV
jgi:hypothetical protein